MPESKERLLRILRRCFSEAEWESLKKERFFAEALEGLEELDDVERVAKTGASWLSDREEKQRRGRGSNRADKGR